MRIYSAFCVLVFAAQASMCFAKPHERKSVTGVALALPGWNWQAVISNIDGFKAAGFSAILLPPHTASCSGPFGGLGYDPSDFTSFDGGFGKATQLREIIRLAHSAGIRVYADMIFNHMCAKSDYNYARFSWNDFHHNGPITDWTSPYQRENHDLVGLNDLAQESSYVRDELANYLQKSNDMEFDGFRWDGVKHVPHWYWQDHVMKKVKAWGKFSVGEVYDANLDLLKSYSDLGMSVTDYNLYFRIFDAFKYGGNLASLDGAGYAGRDQEHAATFVENHDVPPPTNRQLAYAFLSTYPGYPFFSQIDLNDPKFKVLIWVHNHLAAGSYINRWKERDLFIFEREGNLLVGINQSGDWQSRWVDSSWVSTNLKDYAGHVGDTATYADKRVLVSIPPMSYVMFAP
jgi:alpha-amylase